MFKFLKKKDIQSEILSDIKGARKSIKVAVSWLTDLDLIEALIDKRKQNVDVKVVLSANEFNIIRFELFEKLQKLGGYVQKWGNEEADDGGFMHFKFYIIDDQLAKSGSYNWSRNARTNAETLDVVPVQGKIEAFNNIFKESHDFFHDIAEPAEKKHELEQIRKKENKEVLTPQIVQSFRRTQKERIEYERKQKVLEQKIAATQALQAKLEAEELASQRKAQYQPKDNVKETKLPPTSYGSQ